MQKVSRSVTKYGNAIKEAKMADSGYSNLQKVIASNCTAITGTSSYT